MKNEIYKHLKFKIGEESCKHEFRLFQEEDYCCKKYCYDVYLFDKAKDENLFGLKVNMLDIQEMSINLCATRHVYAS